MPVHARSRPATARDAGHRPDPIPRAGRRSLLRAAAVTVGLLGAAGLAPLSGCAGLGGLTEITVSERELAAQLARRFPMQHSVVGLVDLQATDPQLQLLPGRNRLALRLVVRVRDRLSGRPVDWPVAFDTALRWSPADQTVRLSEPQVSPASDGGLQRATAWLVARLLDDQVVHRLDDGQRQRLARLGLEPAGLRVTERGLVIALQRRGATDGARAQAHPAPVDAATAPG